MFCSQVHVTTMFNLSPITMARMTTTMNDVAMQNMFLLTNNILPHTLVKKWGFYNSDRTCMKPWGKILNKGAKNFFFVSIHGAPTLVDFCTYV